MKTYLEQRREKVLIRVADKKKKGIAKRSKKMTDQMKIYNRERIEFLKSHMICEVITCDNWSTDVHHRKGRIGSLLLDQDTWMAVCRVCHDRIERHPLWAKAMGYSLNRLT